MSRMRKRRVRAVALAGVVMSLLTGCDSTSSLFNESHIPENQPQAGAVNLAVTFVAPWDDFAEVLKPGFTLTGDAAVGKVIPRTAAVQEKLLDALGVSAKAGLPTSAISRSRTATDTDGVPGGSSEVSKTSGPGTVPDQSAIPGLPERAAAALPGLTDAQQSLGDDPMLEYTAATALYQEVQLLNRYVQNAAQKHGYHPYLVRLQLGVMPYARNQPYDVYSTLSFFPEAEDARELDRRLDRLSSRITRLKEEIKVLSKDERNAEDAIRLTEARKRLGKDQLEYADLSVRYATARKARADLPALRKAFVVPLLVTDNLEGTLKSRAVDTLRQLSFALSFLVQGLAGEAGLNRLREDLKSVIGTDINGLLTVGQISDNVIQVRLGAARQPSAGYAMIPRTHNISVLLMVPNDYAAGDGFNPHVKVIGRNTFRNANTGEALKRRGTSGEHEELKAALTRIYSELREDPPAAFDAGDTSKLIIYHLRNDFPRFRAYLRRIGLRRGPARAAWIAVAENLLRSELTGVRFDLPRRLVGRLPDSNQTVLLRDDTKNTMTARLHGGAGIKPSLMRARLDLKLEDQVDPLPIYANAIKVGDGGRDPLLSFPSAAAWNLTSIELAGSKLNLCLAEAGPWRAGGPPPSCDFDTGTTIASLLYRPKETPVKPPLFELVQPLSVVPVAKGATAGTAILHVKAKTKDKVPLVDEITFTVTNADVPSIDEVRTVAGKSQSRSLKSNLGTFTVKTDATVTLHLNSLTDGTEVVLVAAGKKAGDTAGGKHAPVKWKVTVAK